MRFGFVGYLEKVLKRHKTRTQHVKLQLPTPAIVLLVAVKALKLQNFSIVEVQPKKILFPGIYIGHYVQGFQVSFASVVCPILF